MKEFNCGGTMGDAYVILCKLYEIAKKEKIICHHWSGQPQYNDLIREIYSLLPNIEVRFTDKKHKGKVLTGHFADKEGYDYNTTFFPDFLKDKFSEFLDEQYNSSRRIGVLQIKSGRPEQKRTLPRKLVDEIIERNDFTVVIGTDGLYGDLTVQDNKKMTVMDTREWSRNHGMSILQSMSIIAGSADSFDGFIGIMSYVAVSHKVSSNIYVTKTYDGSEKRLSNVWGDYAKVVRI